MQMRIEVPADALVVLVAPAGAGKSSFAREHFRDTEIVSSDRCRALVSDDEANQQATSVAFEVFDAILRGRLRLGRLSVADATNLDAASRLRLLQLAHAYGRPAVAILLDVPADIARAQNLARRRSVPPHVLELHFARFSAAREAVSAEGFAAVYELQPGRPVEIVRIGVPPTGPGPSDPRSRAPSADRL